MVLSDKSETALSQGFMILTVDDVAEGGSEVHMQRMKQLEGYTFGKISELQTPEGSTYTLAGIFARWKIVVSRVT